MTTCMEAEMATGFMAERERMIFKDTAVEMFSRVDETMTPFMAAKVATR